MANTSLRKCQQKGQRWRRGVDIHHDLEGASEIGARRQSVLALFTSVPGSQSSQRGIRLSVAPAMMTDLRFPSIALLIVGSLVAAYHVR